MPPRARYSLPESRRFGYTVGGAFALLALLAAWSERSVPAMVLGTIGAVLIVAGLLAPGILVPVQRAWMAGARAISRVTTPIVLGILWFVGITPMALLSRIFRSRSGGPGAGRGTFWVLRTGSARRSNLNRQF